jgi:hypothetical protein
MKTKLVVALAVSLTLGVSGAAQAQARSHFGPQIGYNFDYEAVLLGAQFSAPIGRHLEFYPSFNYFFVNVGTVWALNADLKYRLPIENADWLYLGGGLNVTLTKFGSLSNTDAGLNLIGGIESRSGNIHPFAEVRLTVGDGSTAQLAGGLNFTLGRHP